MTVWQYTDSTNTVVMTTWPNGSIESCLVTAPDYVASVAAGATTIAASAPVPVISPISMWSARVTMAATPYNPSSALVEYQTIVAGTSNLLAATNALVTAIASPEVSAYWEYAAILNIGDTNLQSLAAALGLSSATVTALFTSAAALTV